MTWATTTGTIMTTANITTFPDYGSGGMIMHVNPPAGPKTALDKLNDLIETTCLTGRKALR
jgi:hypothetical protein